MKKILMIVAMILLPAAGGGVAYFMLASDEPVSEAGAEGAEAEEEQTEDALYLSLNPAFVVNFEHNGSIRYMQLGMEVMAYDQAVLDKVSNNIPAVRNKLILMFSGQDYDSLNTVEGKEALRAQVLESVNEVVRLKAPGNVSEVFFTSFVMQ